MVSSLNLVLGPESLIFSLVSEQALCRLEANDGSASKDVLSMKVQVGSNLKFIRK